MLVTRALLVAVLIFSAVFIVQTDFGRQEFYLGTTAPNRQALIVSTWNDFPDHKLTDVDTFPAQALQAYQALKSIGYSDDEITLMVYHTGDEFIDGDGDGVNDLDGAVVDYENGEVNINNLRKEITRIAFLTDGSTEVVIYIVSHGGYSGYENAFTFENGEKMSTSELKGLLAPIKTENLFLFLDFCYSGAFVGEEYPSNGVYLWAASGNNLDIFYWNFKNIPEADKAIFGQSGSVFFHPFWKVIGEGGGVVRAYQFGCSQLLRWQEVDPTIYRQGVDLPVKQSPSLHIEKPWHNDIHNLAVSLGYAGVTLIGVMLMLYASALGITVYGWRRPRRS